MDGHPEYKAVFENSGYWSCACRPEVQDYIVSISKSLLDNYGVHGLHLDYIRTGGLCTCDYCAGHMKEQGHDIRSVKKFEPGLEAWAGDALFPWAEWRAQRVSELVSRCHDLTKAAKRELSAAVFAGYPDTNLYQGQDWVDWAEKGIIDYIFPMSYTNSTREVRMRTRSHRALLGNKVQLWEGLAKGLGTQHIDRKVRIDQIDACRQEGAEGFVLFCYPSISDADLAVLKNI
jgi:uncharacterized lipoprotein YddW (UPF0748 family)